MSGDIAFCCDRAIATDRAYLRTVQYSTENNILQFCLRLYVASA